jgi:hypothetical protein
MGAALLSDSPKSSFTLHQAQQQQLADPNAPLGLRLHEKFDYERLKLDFKLKEADNRFLQEELENKDRMLAMLTVGLKEVRIGLCNVTVPLSRECAAVRCVRADD